MIAQFQAHCTNSCFVNNINGYGTEVYGGMSRWPMRRVMYQILCQAVKGSTPRAVLDPLERSTPDATDRDDNELA